MSGRLRLACAPALGTSWSSSSSQRGLRRLRRRAGLRLRSLSAQPVSIRLRASASRLCPPAQLLSSLRGESTQRDHHPTGGDSETSGGGLRLRQGPPNIAGAVPVLPRPVSRHSAGQEILCPRGRRQTSGFLRGQLKASPRLDSSGTSLCPALWQTQIVALFRASLCPGVEAGGGGGGGVLWRPRQCGSEHPENLLTSSRGNPCNV
jgi:hypothetical protein